MPARLTAMERTATITTAAVALALCALCGPKPAEVTRNVTAELRADLSARESMYQELKAGGIDTTAAPYDSLRSLLAGMRALAAEGDDLLSRSERYIALSERMDALTAGHGITQLDLRTMEKQVYTFLRSVTNSIEEVEKGIRENRQRLYDSGADDDSEAGRALIGLDALKQSMSTKTAHIKRIIDAIDARAAGMRTVWIGPGTALGTAVDDITALSDELNGLSAQVHALQKKLSDTK